MLLDLLLGLILAVAVVPVWCVGLVVRRAYRRQAQLDRLYNWTPMHREYRAGGRFN